MKIIYLTEAEKSLDDIFDFIKVSNERAAVEVYNTILDEIEKLLAFPNLGKSSNAIIGVRTLVIAKNYKVVYIVDRTQIYVLFIWDCRQNPKNFHAKVRKSLK